MFSLLQVFMSSGVVYFHFWQIQQTLSKSGFAELAAGRINVYFTEQSYRRTRFQSQLFENLIVASFVQFFLPLCLTLPYGAYEVKWIISLHHIDTVAKLFFSFMSNGFVVWIDITLSKFDSQSIR